MGFRDLPIEPGRLDRNVVIEQRPATDAVEGSGFPSDGPWTTLDQAWMAKLDLSGRERFAQQQTSAAADTLWLSHYRADLDPDRLDVPKLRRLRYQGRAYDIVNAEHLGRCEGIVLTTLVNTGVPPA